MNEIKNRGGARSTGLARKGRIDQEHTGAVNINDEVLVLSAIWHALSTGIETVILTADEDIVEVFQKAQWFFDTHYRAWLVARLIHEGRYGEPAGTLQETHGLFAGPLTLYRRPTNNLHEVLPFNHSPVYVSLAYVAPTDTIFNWSFPYEREMLGMLEMKTNTEGRCTDLLGQDNLHVDLGPLTRDLQHLCLGIGQDNGNWSYSDDTRHFISALDMIHSVNCRERRAIHWLVNPPEQSAGR